jgi:hypothetical protein
VRTIRPSRKHTPRNKPLHTLARTDIASRRHPSRTLSHTPALGTGLAMAGATGAAAQSPPKRRNPCRDRAYPPSDQDGRGRPQTSQRTGLAHAGRPR